MKWRARSFPWFDDMGLILGDTLVTGRYGFYGSLEEDSDIKKDIGVNDDDELSSLCPIGIATSQGSTSQLFTQLDS
jgi:hypothetical protein